MLIKDTEGLGPNQVTLEYVRGDSKSIEFTRVDKDGARKDITGATYVLSVDSRPDPDDGTTAVFSNAGSITDAAQGELEVPVSSTDSDQTAPQVYYFDLVETLSGNAETVAKGEFRLKMDVGK